MYDLGLSRHTVNNANWNGSGFVLPAASEQRFGLTQAASELTLPGGGGAAAAPATGRHTLHC